MNLNKTQKGYLEIGAAVAIWAIANGAIVRWIGQGAEIIYGIGAAVGFIFVLVWLLLKNKENDGTVANQLKLILKLL